MSIPRRMVDSSQLSGSSISRERLTGVRQLDEAWRVHAADLGIQLRWSPLLLAGSTSAVLVSLGAVVAGVAGASSALLLVIVTLAVIGRLRAQRVARRAEAMLPEICVRLSRTIRSGRAIDDAFEEIVGNVSPLLVGVSRVVAQSRAGRPLGLAIDEWVRQAESGAERLLSSALCVGLRQGGDLAITLDVVGGGLRDDLELDARRRVLLVQATMSAAVLVLLPVVFAIVASVLRGGLVFQGRLGVVLVVAGLGLDALGCLWMRSLMRGLR